MRQQARSTHVIAVADNVTPVWLLTFWRLVKGEARGDFAVAYRALPKHLPPSVRPPVVEEMAIVLAIHRLV